MKLWEKTMNELEPGLVAGAMEYERKRSAGKRTHGRLSGRRLLPAAACLVLLLAGAAVILFRQAEPQDLSALWNAGTLQQDSSFESSYQVTVREAPYAAYQSTYVCDPALTGEKLGEVTVLGGWYRVQYKPDGTARTEGPEGGGEILRAEVFGIRGVSPDTAVCLKYLDKGEGLSTDHYYSFLNPDKDFGKLADFLAGTAAADRLSLRRQAGTAPLLLESVSGKKIARTSYDLDGAAEEKLLKALFACGGPASSETSETILSACTKRLTCRLKLEGIAVWDLTVFDNGYLRLEPSGVQLPGNISLQFRIGDAAKELIRLAEQQGVRRTVDPAATVTGTSGAAQPE